MVIGKLFISGILTFVLFDSRATHSFASSEYVGRLDRVPDTIEISYSIMIPLGDTTQTNLVLRGCVVPIEGRELYVDLIVFGVNDYNVVLGMDWLSKYGATIDCPKKILTF